jgi:hypothetical protein
MKQKICEYFGWYIFRPYIDGFLNMSSGDVVLDGFEDVIFISAPPEIVHIKVRQRRSLEHGDADCRSFKQCV